MLGAHWPGCTILSNDDFWDPKNIQLFEEGKERSSNKPNINVKIYSYKSKKSGLDKETLKNILIDIKESERRKNKN